MVGLKAELMADEWAEQSVASWVGPMAGPLAVASVVRLVALRAAYLVGSTADKLGRM